MVLVFGVRVAESYVGLGYQGACVGAGAIGDVTDHICVICICHDGPRGVYRGWVLWYKLTVWQVSLNVVTQIVPGTLLPRNPQANMVRWVVVFVISV